MESCRACPGAAPAGGIASAWKHGHDALEAAADVELVGRGQKGPNENAPAPAVFSAELDVFRSNPVLHEEIFGAASLVVRYKGIEDLIDATNKHLCVSRTDKWRIFSRRWCRLVAVCQSLTGQA